MKGKFRFQVLLLYMVVYCMLGTVILVFQYRHEQTLRKQSISSTLSTCASMVNSYLKNHGERYQEASQLLPEHYRLTVMNQQGKVLYDNSMAPEEMENHRNRPEIQNALLEGAGDAIRKSSTTNREYFYHAELFNHSFVRIAIPYTKDLKDILATDPQFLYILLITFVLGLFIMYFIMNRMGKGLSRLKEFIHRVDVGQSYSSIQMPDSEIGDIGRAIMQNYKLLEESNQRTQIEREKLLQHFMHATEGVALFDSKRNLFYSNTHFVQYVNILRDEPIIQLERILEYEEFKPVLPFIEETKINANQHTTPILELHLSKGGNYFLARVLLFPDKSFEISLRDVSKKEENQIMKQQMTSNIAHELRTPVSSIQGYIETLLRNKTIDAEQQHHFLTKAYDQCERLAQLIQSITQIATTGEKNETNQVTEVNLHDLFEEATTELRDKIQEVQATVENNLPENLTIEGEQQQLFAIWRNLLENSLRYAGRDTKIHVGQSTADSKYTYLVYYDTGNGVPEEHLARIFERFYRIDQGRTRANGGTGLGLAIVKNVIERHGGQILAKQHKPQGLEFVISLSKKYPAPLDPTKE